MCFPKQPKPQPVPAYTPPARSEKQETAVKIAAVDNSGSDVVDDQKRRRKVSTSLGL